MSDKERLILRDHFKIYDCENGEVELETWTDGGVNMIIYLDTTREETITQQFKNYVDNFDVDEEIDIHRQGKDYRDMFTITESVNDFENYLDWLKCVVNVLETDITEIRYLCKKYALNTLIDLYIDDFNHTKDILELMMLVDDDKLQDFLIEKFESNYDFDELRTKLNERLEV